MTFAGQPEKQCGIIQELLKTPVVKDVLRNSLSSLQHKDGRTGVKVAMSQDPEVFLNLAATIPALLNILIRSLSELGIQLKAQYSPGILAAFMQSLARDVDLRSLKECVSVWRDLAASLWESRPEVRRAVLDGVLAKGQKIGAQGINHLSRMINDMERKEPGTLGEFLSGIFMQVDREELSRATQAVAGAILDQNLSLFSWSWRLIAVRVRKRLKGAGGGRS